MSLVFISNCWRMERLGSLASRMEWQLPHTTVSAWPNERSAMAAPHFGQFSAFACGFGGPESRGVPALITSPRDCADFSIYVFQSHGVHRDTEPARDRYNRAWRIFRIPCVDRRRLHLFYPNTETAIRLRPLGSAPG